MIPDEILQWVQVNGEYQLSPVQEMILRQAWQGETYAMMAKDFHYEAAYLKKVAAELWQLLSSLFEESINKANIREVLELRSLTEKEHQILRDDPNNLAQVTSSPLLHLKNKFPSCPVPLDSKLYVNRPLLEDLAYQEMMTPGGLVRIKAPHRMGKSSLLVRLIAHATAQNYRTAYLDFNHLHDNILESQDKFLRWFCANVSEHLGLEPCLEEYWDDEVGGGTSCTLYFKRYLLERSVNPLILVLNEVDQIFEYEAIARIFLPLLRSWHEEGKRVPLMQRLRVVVAYSTEMYVRLNVNQSPFNVGLPIHLQPFNLQQLQDLALSHGLTWTQEEIGLQRLKALFSLTGGHPYLVQLALYTLSLGEVTLDKLLQDAPTLSGIYRDHLRCHFVALQSRPELALAFRKVVTSLQGITLSPVLAYELDSMGLVTLQGNQVFPSCDLYRLYFASQLS